MRLHSLEGPLDCEAPALFSDGGRFFPLVDCVGDRVIAKGLGEGQTADAGADLGLSVQWMKRGEGIWLAYD